MKKVEFSKSNNILFGKISNLLSEARKYVVASVNQTIVLTYFDIGRYVNSKDNTIHHYMSDWC